MGGVDNVGLASSSSTGGRCISLFFALAFLPLLFSVGIGGDELRKAVSCAGGGGGSAWFFCRWPLRAPSSASSLWGDGVLGFSVRFGPKRRDPSSHTIDLTELESHVVVQLLLPVSSAVPILPANVADALDRVRPSPAFVGHRRPIVSPLAVAIRCAWPIRVLRLRDAAPFLLFLVDVVLRFAVSILAYTSLRALLELLFSMHQICHCSPLLAYDSASRVDPEYEQQNETRGISQHVSLRNWLVGVRRCRREHW